jgi:hypothetical protein
MAQILRANAFPVKYVGYAVGIGACLFLFIHIFNSTINNLIGITVYQAEPTYFFSAFHSLWPYMLTSCLIPAFLEAITFQGVIQSSLHDLKPLRACLTVGLLFGLLIGGSGAIMGSSILTVLYCAIYGFVLSYISIQSGSIFPSVIAGFVYYLFSYGEFENMLYQYCLKPLGISESIAATGLLALALIIGGLLLIKMPRTQSAGKPFRLPSFRQFRNRLTQPYLPVPEKAGASDALRAEETPDAAETASPCAQRQEEADAGENPAKNKRTGFIIGAVLLAALALAAFCLSIYMMIAQYDSMGF